MDILQKARLLADAGKYDSCGPKVCSVDVQRNLGGVINAKSEHKTCRMFKTLMSNACAFDCKYCSNQAGCTKRVAAYKPGELATLFDYMHKQQDVNGLFLSSGVIGGDPDRTTERMLEAARLLRYKHRFNGYLHFKVLPGTSYHLIQEAAELASRMSVNIEAPNKGVMHELSSCKEFSSDILKRQFWVKKQRLNAGQSTQIIINDMADDKSVLKMMRWQYENVQLKRMYYSAFRPVPGTPLGNKPAESKRREVHLYNTDFLFREYGFGMGELTSIMDGGMLPDEDPKVALAKMFFRDGPLDLNDASYDELIRIPGIGPKTAQRLLWQRRRLHSFDQAKRAGMNIRRAAPFVTIEGKRQLSLGAFS